jgi:hypothetical protein
MGSRAPVPARPAERTGTRNRCRRLSLGRWLPVPASPGRLRLRWLVRRVSLIAGLLACSEASTTCLRNDDAERGEGQGRRQCISRPTTRTGLPYQHPHRARNTPTAVTSEQRVRSLDLSGSECPSGPWVRSRGYPKERTQSGFVSPQFGNWRCVSPQRRSHHHRDQRGGGVFARLARHQSLHRHPLTVQESKTSAGRREVDLPVGLVTELWSLAATSPCTDPDDPVLVGT